MSLKNGLTLEELAVIRHHIETETNNGIRIQEAIAYGVKIGEGLIEKRLKKVRKQLIRGLEYTLIKYYLLGETPIADPMEVFYQKSHGLEVPTMDSSSNTSGDSSD